MSNLADMKSQIILVRNLSNVSNGGHKKQFTAYLHSGWPFESVSFSFKGKVVNMWHVNHIDIMLSDRSSLTSKTD